jgi:hypothetical protein
MNGTMRWWVPLGAIILLANPALAQTDLETRLRDALRAATAQVRALEDERTALLAKQSQLESELKTLKAEGSPAASNAAGAAVAAQYEKVFQEREQAYKAAVDEFNMRLQEERDQLLQMQESAQKWKGAYDDAAVKLKAGASEREALQRQVADAGGQIERCQTQNQALFRVGNEILDRYRDVGVTDVIATREPFLGLKRVELENLVQDYDDRLLDNRFDAAAAPLSEYAAPPTETAPR